MSLDFVVFRRGRFVLGQENGIPYLTAGGRKFTLSCHPYEPCLYITDEEGQLTVVRNAFDPSVVLAEFSENRSVKSASGLEYGPEEFCRMVEYAAGKGNIDIDDAEVVFGARAQGGMIIENDPFWVAIAGYPDIVIDYCLVRNEHIARGSEAHRIALACACYRLFVGDEAAEDGEPEEGEPENGEGADDGGAEDGVDGDCADGDSADVPGELWQYDVGKAAAKQVSGEVLFAPVRTGGPLNYRSAFLHPPFGDVYSDADFEKVNAVLFPKGTDALEVFEWTTDWSEYFDDGSEWWGAICYTVYDPALDRFVVIMASATD